MLWIMEKCDAVEIQISLFDCELTDATDVITFSVRDDEPQWME